MALCRNQEILINQSDIAQTIIKIDAWLDTMRTPDGYGGPVVHWWQDCLLYTGPGLDWRYEGIIFGYLNLFEKTRDRKWLDKARRAGDDLVNGQLPSGGSSSANFRNSSFENNPQAGGTPHEAACDLALIRLAHSLRQLGISEWRVYASVAERNLQDFVIDVLWDAERLRFRNSAGDHSFVPNKAATIVDALIAWSELTGDEFWSEQYARPTLELICECQLRDADSQYDGAIYQAVTEKQNNGRFFPFYIARCIPALVKGYRYWEESRFLDTAKAAMEFILRHRHDVGSFPQVIYQSGRINRYPQWVAGAGDILRAMDDLAAVGLDVDTGPTIAWLLQGAKRSVAITSAVGFAGHISQRPETAPLDFRDLVPVCGWVDKAFRYLTGYMKDQIPECPAGNIDLCQPCIFGNQNGIYIETEELIQIQREDEIIYHWAKDTPWAKQRFFKAP